MTKSNLINEIKKIQSALNYSLNDIIKPASGALKYDYLVPAGPYTEQWDWDAFFMAGTLISIKKDNATYMKNWALNHVLNSDDYGKVAGCITEKGSDPRLHQMKPLLAQGILIASKNLNNYNWYQVHWEKIKKIVNYRFDHFWFDKYDLGVWFDSMESGADNNPASLFHENKSVISVDFNTFMYRECLSMETLSKKLSLEKDYEYYKEKANSIKKSMKKYLWNEKDQTFWNWDIKKAQHIKCVSYSNFLPLWEKDLLEKKEAESTIARYLLSEDHLLSKFGIRSLSKNDPIYNNINMIKPHSNWQGPIWPIANYLYIQGLVNFGFKDKAIEICLKIHELLIKDIAKSGGMHENYDAETGEPLAAPNFVSWNILFINCLEDILNNKNPFSIQDIS